MSKKIIKSSFLISSRLWLALIMIIFLISLGFTGYYFYFGYEAVNALYMTIITIGTVGFGEVMPLNDEGKIFTSILILLSIFIFAYSVTTISAYLVSINSFLDYKQKKMSLKIESMNNHAIICGYGRNGKQAALKLNQYRKNYVIIEQDEDILEELQDLGIPHVEGNATEDETLQKAGITRAGYLISSLPSDADNVFITLSARQLNPKINIYSRASYESSVNKLKIAGASHVIMPDKIGGDHMASLIVAPDLIEFLDNLSSSESGHINVQEILLTNMPDIKNLTELNIKEKTGCTIIGYKTSQGNYVINPDDNQPVDSNGRIIVLGNELQIEQLNHFFKTVTF